MKDKCFYELRDIIPKRESIPEEVEADLQERAEAQARREQAEAQRKAEEQSKAERKEEELKILAETAGLSVEEYNSLINALKKECYEYNLYDCGSDITDIKIIKKDNILYYQIYTYGGEELLKV